jgi:predicted metal-dependent phosphoesterase TrpH
LQLNGGNIKADLHTHTNYSDGVLSPEQLINKAKNAGLSYLAITDHDNVDAVEEAIETGKSIGVEVIPGVEISSDHNGREVHVLAYFFNYKDEEFLSYLKHVRGERYKRAERIVEKLNEINIPIKLDDVLAQVKGSGSIGRPHIAVALLEAGYVDTYIETFNKYIGDGKPAYVKKPNLSTQEAIKLIARSGGLSFLAHPGRNIRDEELCQIIEFGIDGIEIIHPSHNQTDSAYFQKTAGQYFLLESGGSDFHGGRINDESVLGKFWINEQKVIAMKNRLFN